ncbi:MAG: UDP-N-acetylglucosamine 1-carboxyvinyltransferase, partial [Oscillospiraceae bacterium]|nr:UDP-N-acetylglucosamine 1-carboxyvinyltransferase [Oscillospiraceae bacterium]
RIAVVTGRNYIQGASFKSGDLRGGAAMVVAGLSAIGDTSISGVEHIDRGYEHIEETFSSLGANIKRKQS